MLSSSLPAIYCEYSSLRSMLRPTSISFCAVKLYDGCKYVSQTTSWTTTSTHYHLPLILRHCRSSLATNLSGVTNHQSFTTIRWLTSQSSTTCNCLCWAIPRVPWSGLIWLGGSSRSVWTLIFRGVHLVGNGWHSFYVRLASSLILLALINVKSHQIGHTKLPVLESLQLDGWDSIEHYIPNFDCPNLTMLVCKYRRPAVIFNDILQEVVHRF